MAGGDQSVKVAVFSAKKYDREFLSAANGSRHELRFFESHLNETTASLALGSVRFACLLTTT